MIDLESYKFIQARKYQAAKLYGRQSANSAPGKPNGVAAPVVQTYLHPHFCAIRNVTWAASHTKAREPLVAKFSLRQWGTLLSSVLVAILLGVLFVAFDKGDILLFDVGEKAFYVDRVRNVPGFILKLLS